MRFILTPSVLVLCLFMVSGCKRQPQSALASPGSREETTTESQKRLAKGPLSGTPPVPLKMQSGEYTELASPIREPQDFVLTSHVVDTGPAVDGVGGDGAWLAATEVVTLDRSSQRPIQMKSVHTADEIFFLVSYPDGAASETHKSWVWHPTETVYKQGSDREDAFVFKWSLVGNEANLSIYRDPQPHRADVWFWKACRTNGVGYADDKRQILGTAPAKNARQLQAPDGDSFFLNREGDAGRSAYRQTVQFDYDGNDVVPKYALRQPEGSRADIRAKGTWNEDRWTIEFGRKLDTTHPDDIVFEPGGRYLFGVSCYEIAGDAPNPGWTQPLYRTGDVFDRLMLIVQE